MDKKDLRIVFMGTPEFAATSLQALVEGGYSVVGVITAPDKPVGRHRNTLVPSAVKQYAVAHGLHLMQPEKLRDESFLTELRALKADLQVVVAFRMLPEVVWAMPRFGTLNLHASLLPQYRGAAPINWAIINGEKESGVTTFFLRHDIDTGDIAMQEKVKIGPEETFGELYDTLMTTGAAMLLRTVDAVAAGTVKSIPQSSIATGESLKPAPKIFPETCMIDWSKSAREIHDLIRGLAPLPTARTTVEYGGKEYTLKIFSCRLREEEPRESAGTFVVGHSGKTLSIAAEGGYIDIDELQLSGHKRLAASVFLNGLRHPEDLKLISVTK
jgi:methionyl-tRNA formyltransferase